MSTLLRRFSYPRPRPRRDGDDHDAIVIGAGHNGLIAAAYLARAGLSVLLVEARPTVGGTASSERFAGAVVNICNCDHLTFRTTPIMEELALTEHGLRYQDMQPSQRLRGWHQEAVVEHHHDVDATLDSIATVLPGEVAGYRAYADAAIPAVRLVLAAANAPPTRIRLTRLAISRQLAGVPTLLRWSRRSAGDVLRSYFGHDALAATGAVGGPMVWGISPDTPGSGLGALAHALRHVGTVGRPIGGSGAMPQAVLAAFVAAGGVMRTGTRVTSIDCEGDHVRGVHFDDGSEATAPIVVSACDPRRTFVQWLSSAPACAAGMIDRWRSTSHEQGYESKIDAVLTSPPILKGVGQATATTMLIAPSLDEIDHGYHLMRDGSILERPALIVNVPTVLDPTMAPTNHPDWHVLSLEVLYTPYGLRGGWPKSHEPRRWLEQFATLCEPGLLESVVNFRAMTPDVYERDFNLPAGHATSFAGGPLAVLRTRDPELTRYDTCVGGLFMTGAATFPGAGVWGASGRNCAGVVLETIR